MNTVNFSCVIAPSTTAILLGSEIWIDNTCVFDQEHVSEPVRVEHEFSDADGEHSLRIRLKNKLPEHTRVDDQGNILEDSLLSVTEIAFDEIDCTQIVQDQAVYRHNFNSTAPDIEDKFFGDLGCNGTVELKFTIPVYLWLLENM
jgi:hypothetical protein